MAERIGARNGTGGAVLREIMRLDTHFWARRVWVDFIKPSCLDGCGEVLCQTNLNALGGLEMCYDVHISDQSPFFSVTQLTTVRLSRRCSLAAAIVRKAWPKSFDWEMQAFSII